MNQVAAFAVTLRHAATAEFASYAQQVLDNAQALAASLREQSVQLVTGGTENHLLVLDTVASFGKDG